MNKNILYFGIGLITGAAAGVIGTMQYWKHKYEKIAEEQAELSRKYVEKASKYSSEITPPGVEINPVQNEDRSQGPLSPEARKEIKEKLERNWQGTTNYAGIYKSKHPEQEDDQNEETNIRERITQEHKDTMDLPPEVITQLEASNLDERWTIRPLYFWTGNEVVLDDDDNLIEDPERVLGDILKRWIVGEFDSMLLQQTDILYVKNYALDVCYEIQEVQEVYEES